MTDLATGEFQVSRPESRKAKRARKTTRDCEHCEGTGGKLLNPEFSCNICRGTGRVKTEASRRGRRSQRIGRIAERKTIRALEAIAPNHVRDYRAFEAANGVTGADWGVVATCGRPPRVTSEGHCALRHPIMPLCGQTKDRQSISIPQAWEALTRARDALQPGAVRVLEARYRTVEGRHTRVVHLAILEKGEAYNLLGFTNWAICDSARPRMRDLAEKYGGRFELWTGDFPTFACYDFADFLRDYERVVNRDNGGSNDTM